MDEKILSELTALGTLAAVFVALFIVIIPSIWNKYKQKAITSIRFKNGFWILHEILRGYFLYNPTKIITPEKIVSYSFTQANTEFFPHINTREIINSLYDSLHFIDSKKQKIFLYNLNCLELIFSGLPQANRCWILVDKELGEIREKYFNDKRNSYYQTIQEMFAESENIKV
jgi:hypothetical protein